MSDKILPKETLDELLELAQVIYSRPCSEEADSAVLKRIEMAKSMPDTVVSGLSWIAFLDLVDTVVRMAQGDKSEALYKVLEVLGWTVE